jgi:hypothetical protein
MLIWLSSSFDGVIAHYGMDPDGPALIMAGLLLLQPVTMIFSFGAFIGLPCVIFLWASGRLRFLALMLFTVLAGLVYGLIIYVSLHPWGDPSVAPAMGVMSALGVLVFSLCFYIVGVWKSGQGKPESPLDQAAHG